MARLRMAVIGVGHLGKEHARILAGLDDVELVGVADVNREQAEAVAQRCNTQAFQDYRPLLSAIDAATIVVPTVFHLSVAAEFLRRGIHLLVEKPLTANLEQADTLVGLAQQHGAMLQVGHIERFNPAFEELQDRPLQPKFVECDRLSSYTGRSTDIGVVLDMMIHDLDLLLVLVRSPVRDVAAVGVSVFGQHEDMVNARLTFENGCVANVTASRVHSAPVRRTRIWSPEGYASIDYGRRSLTLVQPSEHLRRHGLKLIRQDPAAFARLRDDLFGQHLEVLTLDRNQGDQLTRELQHFVHCARTGARPRVSGEDGREAIALADWVLESVRQHRWDGHADGVSGPFQVPPPLGPLFLQPQREAAA